MNSNQSSNPSGLQTTESATIEDEYEYTDSSSGEEDVQIILNADDRVVAEKRLDQNAEGTNEGNVYIPDEDMKSAFEIDINKLKLRKWEMTGDESDYFNYGMNESMWKVEQFSRPHVGLCPAHQSTTRKSEHQGAPRAQ